MTASAHPLVFRPLVALLEARGDEVEITARDYAQTLQLIEQHGIDGDDDQGTSRGVARGAREGTAASPRGSGQLRKDWAKGRDFEDGARPRVARVGDHGAPAPGSQKHDDLRLRVGVAPASARLPDRRRGSSCPTSIPAERLARYGAVPPKLLFYPGLGRRSTTSRTSSRIRRCSPGSSSTRPGTLVVLRRPRRVAVPPPLEPALPADAPAPRPARERSCGGAAPHRKSSAKTSVRSSSPR